MAMVKLSCEQFVQELAAKKPVPGGGGAAALVGAIGMALGSMVANYTLGKPKYAAVAEKIADLNHKATALQTELLLLVEADAAAFAPLAEAYALPEESEAEQAHKTLTMEKCLHQAAEIPLKMMKASAMAIDLAGEFAAHGSTLMISDAGCSAIICKAALQAAALNVFVNTKLMQDKAYAESLNQEAELLLTRYTIFAERVYNEVKGKCKV